MLIFQSFSICCIKGKYKLVAVLQKDTNLQKRRGPSNGFKHCQADGYYSNTKICQQVFSKHYFFLTQLSQLGTEIGVFDSANAVSFHHKAMHLTDGYIPSAAG